MWEVLLGCVIMMTGVASSEVVESWLVNTTNGPVRGYKDSDEDVRAFLSIRYAVPPTGPNRFKGPLKPTPWTEVFEAVDQGIVCPQWKEPAFGVDTTNKSMQEDCLIANLYRPNTNDVNLPVIVYIHGGGFVIGYGDLLKPKKLVATKKVLALNFNYRLGAHGFLCLGTSNVPGNAGLKDQVALLRWVQANIANFGGDPGKVTIAGYSAGGSAVGLLMISKMASGLFAQIIQESGDIGAPFDMQVHPIQNAKEYAGLLEFSDVDNCTALESFYMNISIDDLQSGNIINKTDSSNLVTPCVERDVGQDEIFLENSPEELIESGNFTKVPMLIGFSNMEGLLREQNFDQWKDEMNANFSNFIPVYLGFSNESEKIEVASQIKTSYFGDKLVSNETILKYIDYITDTAFVCPCMRTIKKILAAGSNNMYLFKYSFVDEASTPVVEYTNVRGAQHIAESYAVLDGVNITYQDESNISNKLRDWKILMRDIWCNFVINGIPSSTELCEWTPATSSNITYMALKESPGLGVLEDCSSLLTLIDTYYQQPSLPAATCSD